PGAHQVGEIRFGLQWINSGEPGIRQYAVTSRGTAETTAEQLEETQFKEAPRSHQGGIYCAQIGFFAGVATTQAIDNHVADAGENMHVLMAVDKIRVLTNNLFEGVEL